MSRARDLSGPGDLRAHRSCTAQPSDSSGHFGCCNTECDGCHSAVCPARRTCNAQPKSTHLPLSPSPLKGGGGTQAKPAHCSRRHRRARGDVDGAACSPSPPPWGGEGRGEVGVFLLSLRRRALAPLAWLRAIRRAAQSRRPVCFAARPLSWPTPCRLPGAKLIISLDGGRELRSLAYAPCGAARGRVLRTMVRWRAQSGRDSIASCKTKPDRP